MSAYENDRRVQAHPDDGTWMVFEGGRSLMEYYVAPLRRGWDIIPGLFGAFDARGYPVPGVAEGPFDDVVRALIGDPR